MSKGVRKVQHSYHVVPGLSEPVLLVYLLDPLVYSLIFFGPGDDVSRPGGPGGTKVGVLRSHGSHMTTQPGQDTEDDTTNRSQRYKRTTMYNVQRLVWSRFAALCFEFVNKWNSFDVYDSLWSLTDRSRNIHKFVAFGVAQGESTGHSQGRQGLDFGCLS